MQQRLCSSTDDESECDLNTISMRRKRFCSRSREISWSIWEANQKRLLPINAITRRTCMHMRIVSSFPTQDFATAKRRPIPPSVYIDSQFSSTRKEIKTQRLVEVRRRRMRQTRSERLFVPRQWMYTSLMHDSK